MNDSDEWVHLVSKAEVYPEGPVVSPVIEANVGVKRSLNLPSADYDGYRRLRKTKNTSQVDTMLEPGAGYSASRRHSRSTSHSASRRTSIDSSSTMAPLTRNFVRASGPDLSFIHDSHPYLASRAERESASMSGFYNSNPSSRSNINPLGTYG